MPSPASFQSLLPQGIEDWARLGTVATHLGNLAYSISEEVEGPGSSRSYEDDASLWRDLRSGPLYEHGKIELKAFRLFDFVPRAPGLFHDEAAKLAREEAFQYLDNRLGDAPAQIDEAWRRDHRVVFAPQGKQSMLDGGVGCVRLKPIIVEGRVRCLMSATSSNEAHQGVPVAVPEELYPALIDRIASEGTVQCDVYGRLAAVPAALVALFSSSPGIPRLYLRVEGIRIRDDMPPVMAPEVSVAVSFLSDYHRPNGVYASYVTFRSGDNASFREALRWLDEVYVRGGYDGRIITDFDQSRSWFPSAAVSLRSVMGGRRDELDPQVLELMHARGMVDELFDVLERENLVRALGGRLRKKVFISYSHLDDGHLRDLRDELGHFPELDLRVWDDRRIVPGTRWADSIRREIATAKVALLFVSQDFMDSDFIREAELPALLEAEERDGLKVLPLFLEPCDLQDAPYVAALQGVNSPDRPLSQMAPEGRRELFRRTVDAIRRVLGGE